MSVTSSTTLGSVAEFVHGAFELDAGDGGAFQRGEEDAAQGVAEGVTVTGFKGFGDELGVVAFGDGFVFRQTIGHFETTEADRHLFLLAGLPGAAICHRDTGPTAKWRCCYLLPLLPHRRSEKGQAVPHSGTAKSGFTGSKAR
jgi:hypothetical protein